MSVFDYPVGPGYLHDLPCISTNREPVVKGEIAKCQERFDGIVIQHSSSVKSLNMSSRKAGAVIGGRRLVRRSDNRT